MEPSLLTTLERSQLFAGQRPAALVELVRQLEVVPLSAGSALFSAGERADDAWLLTLGTLQVVAADGTLLDTEQPGALIGEQALMPGGSGTRSASIVARTDCRLLRIDRRTFEALLDRQREHLEALSDARTRNRLSRLAAPLRALLADSTPKSWADDGFVFRAGQPADGIHVVLSGQAQVVLQQGGEPVHIATVYPGQIFGEIGVLSGAPRSASVIAQGSLRTAFIAAERVRALQERAPDLGAFLTSLLRSRELPRLGLVHQRAVLSGGQSCIQTVFSLDDGRELVGLRTPDGHYTLTQTGSAAAETVRIAATTAVQLDASGRIVGFTDQGDYEDISGLQALALDGSPLSRQQKRTLKKAARAAADLAPDAVICRCLSIERQVLQAAIDSGARTTAAVKEATGCGTGCGGCLRKVAAMLPGADAPRPPVETLGPPQKPGGFMGWLRGVLG